MTASFGLLGPLEVRDADDALVDVGGRQPRLVLALLLAAQGMPVPPGALVDALWGDEPPASAGGTLQSYVSRLRRHLGALGLDGGLTLDDAGYRLAIPAGTLDIDRFEALVADGRAALARGDAASARVALRDADALWRGPALVDLADVAGAAATATRLEEERLAAEESRFDAELALGQHADAAAELAELVAAHPLREGLATRLALALYRSGRQADALRALATTAATLRDELGLEPGRPVRELEAAILAHDPALDGPSPSAPELAAAPAPAAATVASPIAEGPGVVGRAEEVAALVAAFDEAATDARFVVIEGEPGIGKTRLADELRRIAAARGSFTAWGRSDEGGAAPALWSWLPPLRAAAAHLGEVPESIAALLGGDAPLLAGQGGALRFDRFEAVAELLTAVGAASPAPAVVLLDDLQWADATSLELLAHLTGHLGRGVLVVATVRQLEVGRIDEVTDVLAAIARRPGSRRLGLRGLDAEGTAALLADAGSGALPAAAISAIHDRAEGNPFYAIELARLTEHEGDLDAEVPGNVGDVIRRRMTRLPATTTELLAVAAVIGRDVDLPLLAQVADPAGPDPYDAIEPAIAQRLLVDTPGRPGALRFTHALVREVLLDDLTSLRRARLHLRVADAIEASGMGVDDVEILAEHLWRAAPVGGGARAAAALEAAAEVAISRISYAAAERHLQRAVQLHRATGAGEAAERAELTAIFRLMEVTAATRNASGADHAALARGRELADRLGETDMALQLFYFEGGAIVSGARMAEMEPAAQRYYERAMADPRPIVRAGGEGAYGISCWVQGRIDEAAQHLGAAIELFGPAVPDDVFTAEQMLMAVTFDLIVQAMAGTRSDEETFATFELLADTVPPVALAPVCAMAVDVSLLLERQDVAAAYERRLEGSAPSADFAFWGGQLVLQRGLQQIRRGEVDEGLATFQVGADQYRTTGGRCGMALFLAGRSAALLDHRPDLAAELLEEAWIEQRDCDERWSLPQLHVVSARVAAASGDPERAAAQLREAVAVAEAQTSPGLAAHARAVAAELGVEVGHPDG